MWNLSLSLTSKSPPWKYNFLKAQNLYSVHLWRVNFLFCGVKRKESVWNIIKMVTTVSALWRRGKWITSWHQGTFGKWGFKNSGKKFYFSVMCDLLPCPSARSTQSLLIRADNISVCLSLSISLSFSLSPRFKISIVLKLTICTTRHMSISNWENKFFTHHWNPIPEQTQHPPGI